jgi:preprotein translocase subunit SecF
MKFRPLFLIISLTMIFVSIFSIAKWGFKTSIDFAGGSVWEIVFSQNVEKSKIEQVFNKAKVDINSLSINGKTVLLKFKNISQDDKLKLESSLKKVDEGLKEQRFETLGPSLGKELLKKTIVAVILSSLALLLFIGSRFSDFSFGASAVIAMFHDAFILVGAFSLLGHFFGAELDSLFVTALLTTLSASVHDTVVTFDRIRELKRKNFKIEWVSLANQAVSEVIVRSINNSMTIIFMLLSLVVLGGATTRWFAMALLIGVVCGTYSSTAVAIPLVLLWKNKKSK